MHLRVFRIDRVLLKCRLVFSTEAGHGSPDEPDGPTVSCCGVSCLSAVWLKRTLQDYSYVLVYVSSVHSSGVWETTGALQHAYVILVWSCRFG